MSVSATRVCKSRCGYFELWRAETGCRRWLVDGGWHLDGAALQLYTGPRVGLATAAAVSLTGRGREYVALVFTLWTLGGGDNTT